MTRRILAFLFVVSSSLLVLSSSLYAQTPERAGKTGASASSRSSSPSTAATQTWEIDTSRSKLTFSLRHLVSRVQGRFGVWSGTLSVPPDNWNNAAVDVVIQASSIDTENADRDDHLRSSDFFDADTYPEIAFKSTSVKRDGDSIAVAGNLTMKGVTKPVVLAGKFLGTTAGQTPRLNFQATTTINRMDYGVSYNRLLEGGGTTLGDEVMIDVVVTAVRK